MPRECLAIIVCWKNTIILIKTLPTTRTTSTSTYYRQKQFTMKWMRHKRMSCLKQVDTSSRLISNNVKSSINWWRFYQNLRKVISIASKEITLSFAGNQVDEDTQLQKLIDYFSSFLWCIEQDGWWEVFLQVHRKNDRAQWHFTFSMFNTESLFAISNFPFISNLISNSKSSCTITALMWKILVQSLSLKCYLYNLVGCLQLWVKD